MNYLNQLLVYGREIHASDIHLSVEKPAMFRVHGKLVSINTALNHDDIEHIVDDLQSHLSSHVSDINDNNIAIQMLKHGSVDFGYTCDNNHRYRVNVYKSQSTLAVALRHLPNNFQNLETLHLPASILSLTESINGLILVCGATGSGKSTTLAALIHSIAHKRAAHIITVEDPIEFIHHSDTSLIHQRELAKDFFDFPTAVKASLREDPDVIMIGEMRDLDTMRAAITAAETGHLVLSTLHTNDAVSSVERLIGAFPGNEQDIMKTRLARCLKSVVAQHLIPTINGLGRVPAAEILINNPAVSNLIESNKTRQLYSVIESSQNLGMQTLDQSLASLIQAKWIDTVTAQQYAKTPANLTELVSRTGRASHGY